MKKRIVCFLAAMLACLCALAGCGGARYHAKLYCNAQIWVDEDFLNENRIYGTPYPNPDYVEGVSNWDEEYIWDETSPRTRTFVIKTEEEYQRIFTKSTVEVDFGKKIVILYMFFDINNRDCKIKRMDMEGETLTIYYKVAYSILEDTSNPFARCFMLVMDRTDFTTVKFIEK